MTVERTPTGHEFIRTTSPAFMARAHHKLAERLPMWIVYGPRTLEFPGKYVARLWVSLPRPKPSRFVILHDTLNELRLLLPPGLTRLARSPADALGVIEVWL